MQFSVISRAKIFEGDFFLCRECNWHILRSADSAIKWNVLYIYIYILSSTNRLFRFSPVYILDCKIFYTATEEATTLRWPNYLFLYNEQVYSRYLCVCVCVCMRKREREWKKVCETERERKEECVWERRRRRRRRRRRKCACVCVCVRACMCMRLRVCVIL